MHLIRTMLTGRVHGRTQVIFSLAVKDGKRPTNRSALTAGSSWKTWSCYATVGPVYTDALSTLA